MIIITIITIIITAKQRPGTFRATFEDKILMSDVVTCRLWVPVEPKQFYNPVLSLLTSASSNGSSSGGGVSEEGGELSSDEVTNGSAPPLMRTTAELRYAMQ